MRTEAVEGFVERLGSHALPAFLVALPLVVGLVAAVWWSLRRFALPRETSRLPAWGFLALHFGLGFGSIAAAAALFAEIAEQIGAGPALAHIDQVFSDAVARSAPTVALRAFVWITHLGDATTQTLVCIAVAAVLTATGRRWLALGWIAAVAGNGILNTTLKNIFERARPIHEHGLVSESSFSFPSGHSSGSVVVYGMLAYLALRTLPGRWHLPAVLAATAVAFTTGCSRIFLQVHFASDVVAGFASGTAWLAVSIVSIELLRRAQSWRALG